MEHRVFDYITSDFMECTGFEPKQKYLIVRFENLTGENGNHAEFVDKNNSVDNIFKNYNSNVKVSF